MSGTVAKQLKGIFVKLSGYVIVKASEALTVDVRLTQAILKYLYQIFCNDKEGFITLDVFKALVKPLVQLVS